MAAKYPQCRYLRRNDERCTGEALDASDDALIVLCAKHVGRVIEFYRTALQRAADRRSA